MIEKLYYILYYKIYGYQYFEIKKLKLDLLYKLWARENCSFQAIK